MTELRFIPFSRADLTQKILSDPELDSEIAESLREIFTLIQSVYHFEFHRQLEAIKASYAPLDPDLDTIPLQDSNASREQHLETLLQQLGEVLNQGNFERITDRDIRDALEEESLFDIRLQVDFDDFENVLFYSRGESQKRAEISRFFGLSSRSITFTNYERVVVFLTFKPAEYFEARGVTPGHFEPGSTVLKLFRNVPKADLEMLFPNTEVRMKTFDKLLIGVPALVSGGVVLATKLGSTLLLLASMFSFWLGFRDEPVVLDQAALIALGLGMGALGGFLWKQYDKFKNRKIRFMKRLTENLYFKNLDNNAGVFHRLIDEAEEEESKEAMLAYFTLVVHGFAMQDDTLDRAVEQWIENTLGASIDFEIDDAIRKLRDLKLVEPEGDGWKAVAPQVAVEILNQRWDDYHQPAL